MRRRLPVAWTLRLDRIVVEIVTSESRIVSAKPFIEGPPIKDFGRSFEVEFSGRKHVRYYR